jgi:hypothetical protein
MACTGCLALGAVGALTQLRVGPRAEQRGREQQAAESADPVGAARAGAGAGESVDGPELATA